MDREWHLDRRVTGGLILAVLAQTVGIGIWAGAMNARMDATERAMNDLKAREAISSAQIARTTEVLARIEERVAQQTALLLRLEQRFDVRRAE